METPASTASKQEWRAWARSSRGALDFAPLSEATVTALSSWPPLVSAHRVLLFLPLPDEIDLRGLIDGGLRAEFAATRTPEEGGRLGVHELGGAMETHALGFEQPVESSPNVSSADLDVLLLPGLAFDLYGTRLGRGAGYFDRLLMEIDATVPVVGVTPTDLVVDRLPRESHDLPVGYLATEEGVVAVAGPQPGPPR